MYYYVGFAYMMMRRYNDAIRTFSNILVYIQRAKGMFQSKTYQNDQINKQTEQMYILLAMCLVLHPKRIDESLHVSIMHNGAKIILDTEWVRISLLVKIVGVR